MIDWGFLSDPDYKPPEGLLDLDFKVDFKGLLEQFSRETLARFAINEARLALHVYEAEYSNDDHPRKALRVAENWLADFTADDAEAAKIVTASNAIAASRAAYSAWAAARAAVRAAYDAVEVASDAAYSTLWIESAADWARRADPSISVENQIKRLLNTL